MDTETEMMIEDRDFFTTSGCVTSGNVFFLSETSSVSRHPCLCTGRQTRRETLAVELALCKWCDLDHLSSVSTEYSRELVSYQQKAALTLQCSLLELWCCWVTTWCSRQHEILDINGCCSCYPNF